MKKKIAVLGLGLIGGSFALACRRHFKNAEIIGWGRNRRRLAGALKNGIIDSFTLRLEDLKGAGIIFIALPVDVIVSLLPRLAFLFSSETLIMDAGSVKEPLAEALGRYPDSKNFVPCHPLAGSEKSGFEYSSAGLFENSAVLLTPSRYTSYRKREEAVLFWKRLGARPVVISPEKHDSFLAVTSHLPHLIASAYLLSYAGTLKKNPQISQMTAGSFQDLTRIARSPGKIWSSIFLQNRKNLLAALRLFKKRLSLYET
ncbi:MAG TPA: prephenate dehydrogenase, partial [bacterium]|nr:prephenate dehydrogenase [bacterium]